MIDSAMRRPDEASHLQNIAGNRRADRRYELRLDLKWKLIRRRKVLDSGTGHTVDLSSGGVMFDAGRELPLGHNVELSVAWPIRLHDVAALQLVISGRIVRTAGGRTALRMVQHEFRTLSETGCLTTQATAFVAGPRIVFSSSTPPQSRVRSVARVPVAPVVN